MALLVCLVPNSVAHSMDRLWFHCLQFFDSKSRSQTAILEISSWEKKEEIKKTLVLTKRISHRKSYHRITKWFVLEGTFTDHLIQFLNKLLLETRCASSHWWASGQLWAARPRALTKALQPAASPLPPPMSHPQQKGRGAPFIPAQPHGELAYPKSLGQYELWKGAAKYFWGQETRWFFCGFLEKKYIRCAVLVYMWLPSSLRKCCSHRKNPGSVKNIYEAMNIRTHVEIILN